MVKEKKGITLIALVITIIVLLILAGIALNALIGEDGIIKKAEQARVESQVSEIKEASDLIKANYKIETQKDYPHPRYTIEKLLEQGKIEESWIVDYGDFSGTGIIKVKDKYIYITGTVTGDFLGYEVEYYNGYAQIRFYPRIEASDTYCDFAIQRLYGKKEEELKEILVEGYNYWEAKWGEDDSYEPYYVDSFEEMAQHFYDEGWIDAVYSNLEDFAVGYGWPSARTMMIGWDCVYPNEYDWNKEEIGQYFSIYDETHNQAFVNYQSTEYMEIAECRIAQSGKYKFSLINESTGEKTSVDIDIQITGELGAENIFITDGNGTIIGLSPSVILYTSQGGASFEISGCGYNIYSISVAEIPARIGDEEIWSIGPGALAGYGINEVIMPNTIIVLDDGALENCYDLEKITFSENIEYIGYGAFDGTIWEQNLEEGEIYIGKVFYKYNGQAPENTQITIREGSTAISHYAFEYQENITSINIPETVYDLGGGAFSGCSLITDINIPDKVTKIREYCFSNCTSINNVNIPNAVTILEEGCFSYCTSLTNINIHSGVTSIGDDAFSDCTNLTSINIPDRVTSIGLGCFYNCTALTELVIPNSVTYIGSGWIGNGTFQNCSSLKSIVLSDNITTFPENCFNGCINLENINIPNKLTLIDGACFYKCSSLKEIVLPDTVTTIESGWNGAFEKCTSLESITLSKNLKTIPRHCFIRLFIVN